MENPKTCENADGAPLRILIVAPLVFAADYIRDKDGDPSLKFARHSVHQSWAGALENAGHVVEGFHHNISPMLPLKFQAFLQALSKRAKKLNVLMQYAGRAASIVFGDLVLRNRGLRGTIARFKPDVVIVTELSEGILDPGWTAVARKDRPCAIIIAQGMTPIAFRDVIDFKLMPHVDAAICNDKAHERDWLMLGAKSAYALPLTAINPDYHRPMDISAAETAEYGSDICFTGKLTKERYDYRLKILDAISDYDLAVWSPWKEELSAYPKLAKRFKGTAWGEKMLKILASSKIALNLHTINMPTGGNLRTFEIPAVGGFQLADRVPEHILAHEKEVVIFDDIGDLRRKIDYYLERPDERKKIAEAGRKRVLADHTTNKRFKRIAEIAGEIVETKKHERNSA